MAYQWRDGRLMSDSEIADSNELTIKLAAIWLPTLALGGLGYWLGGEWLAWILAAVGAYIGWAFQVFFMWIVIGLVLLGTLAAVGFFIWYSPS